MLELDESIYDGLRREVVEETGLWVDPGRLTGVYKNINLGVVALVFRAHVVSGQPGPTDEVRTVAWWWPDEIRAGMVEAFAVRAVDALDEPDNGPASGSVRIRLHDGVQLLPDRDTRPPPNAER